MARLALTLIASAAALAAALPSSASALPLERPAPDAALSSWAPAGALERDALAAVERTAPTLLKVNPSATRYVIWSCAQESRRGFACGIRLYLADSSADLVFSVRPELIRKRRGGRWVGAWRPTGELAVVDARPFDVPAEARPDALGVRSS